MTNRKYCAVFGCMNSSITHPDISFFKLPGNSERALVDKYTGLTKERFNTLMERYRTFQETCDDLTKAPVKVFDNVTAKSLAELDLIREVSKDLQKKKEEDAKKAKAHEEEVKKVEVESDVVQEVEEEKKVE